MLILMCTATYRFYFWIYPNKRDVISLGMLGSLSFLMELTILLYTVLTRVTHISSRHWTLFVKMWRKERELEEIKEFYRLLVLSS